MKSKSFIDDSVLLSLLQNDSSTIVAKEIFKKYKQSFVCFFEQKEKMPVSKIETLYANAFDLFILDVSQKQSWTGVDQTLFSTLLMKGYELLNKRLPEKCKKPAYLAGEVLIQLILKKHTQCVPFIFRGFEDLTIALLTRHYGHCFSLPPQEIYGEAVMVLKSNIETGRLNPALRSRLFTYFFLIARNKYLDLAKHMKRLVFSPEIIELEGELKVEKEEVSFMNYLEDSCPEITQMIDTSNENAFQSLLATFKEEEQELLRLRFEEGLKYSEIGARLQLKESTCRKRLHSCLKKWRQKFVEKNKLKKVGHGKKRRA